MGEAYRMIQTEELNVIQKIEMLMPEMTKVQKRMAARILKEPTLVAFSSVEQIAKETGVSTASVVRFANALGFEGYSELQMEIRKYCRDLLSPVERLDKNYKVYQGKGNMLRQVYEQQYANLQSILTADIEDKIDRTVEFIRNARQIYTLGVRGSFSASYYLGHHLNRVLQNCDVLKVDDALPEWLGRMTGEDLMIVVNMPRYDRRIHKAAEIAKEKGVRLVAISDSVMAPYAAISDVFFSVPNQSGDFHNSLLSTFLIIETIISSVIALEYQDTRKKLRDLEDVFKRLETFVEA